jgi:hypothetical protein
LGQRRGLKKPWAGEEENKNALPGCVWVSSPKRLEQPHAELVHWWLLIHFSPFFTSHSSARNHATRFSMFFNSSTKKIEEHFVDVLRCQRSARTFCIRGLGLNLKPSLLEM